MATSFLPMYSWLKLSYKAMFNFKGAWEYSLASCTQEGSNNQGYLLHCGL